MQQPQKGASAQSAWLVLHSSWICAESMLRWLAHPRLQPWTSVWQESEAQPRGTSAPALCTHCPRTQPTSERAVWMPQAHPGVTSLPTAWTRARPWWLADWMGLTPCCWSEGRCGQPWNATSQWSHPKLCRNLHGQPQAGFVRAGFSTAWERPRRGAWSSQQPLAWLFVPSSKKHNNALLWLHQVW